MGWKNLGVVFFAALLCGTAFLFLSRAGMAYAAGIVVDTTTHQVPHEAEVVPTATPTNTASPTATQIFPCLFSDCSAYNLFPITIAQATFVDENGDGVRDIHYEETDPTYNYIIWENNVIASAHFSYLHWQSQSTDAATLAGNMADPTHSGVWELPAWAETSDR